MKRFNNAIDMLERLNEYFKSINRLNLTAMYAGLANEVKDIFDAELVVCSRLGEDGKIRTASVSANGGVNRENILDDDRGRVYNALLESGKQTCRSSDLPLTDELKTGGLKPPFKMMMSGLLSYNGNTIGVAEVYGRKSQNDVSEDEARLFSVILDHFAYTLGASQSMDRMQKQLRDDSMLFDVSKACISTIELESLLNLIMEMSINILSAEVGCILLYDENTLDYKAVVTWGLGEEFLRKIEMSDGNDVVQWALSAGPIPFVIKDVNSDASVKKKDNAGYGMNVKSLLFSPLIIKDNVIGAIFVANKTDGGVFDDNDINTVSALSNHMSLAITNARLYDNLQRRLNELSSLYNVSRSLGATYQMDKICSYIFDSMEEMFGIEGGALFTAEKGADGSLLEASRNMEEDEVRNIEKSLSGAISREKSAGDEVKEILYLDRYENIIAIPLISGDEIIGYIVAVFPGSAAGIKDDQEKLLSILSTHMAVSVSNALSYRNATERKMVDLSLLHEFARQDIESYTKNIIESIPVGIITLDTHGKTIVFNKTAEKILELKIVEGKDVFYRDAIAKLEESGIGKIVDDVMKTGRTHDSFDLLYRGGENQHKNLSINVSLFKNTEGKALGVVIVIDDVTNKKILEERVQRTERLAALGELSAGVAHEIKNPLTSIKGFTQLLDAKIMDEKFRHKYIGVVTDEVDRLNKIVEALLSFARPSEYRMTKNNINEIIDKVMILVEHEAEKRNVSILKNFGDSIPEVVSDGKQLQQVFLNIIVNAIQSMENEGKLTITTRHNETNKSVVVSVADTGYGISKDNMEKLFNPFFSTKAEGTGLGLSISNRIVDDHGGSISIKSVVGKGSVFSVTLPLEVQQKMKFVQ